MVWIEFKREGEKPAPIQAYVHSQLREMKFQVFTIDSFSVFQTVLEYLKGLPHQFGSQLIIKSEVSSG
jgi:adenylate kinase